MSKKPEYKKTELGAELKTYRIKNHITQPKMAEMLEVSTNTIRLWETTSSKPAMGSLLRISALLDESLSQVIEHSKHVIE